MLREQRANIEKQVSLNQQVLEERKQIREDQQTLRQLREEISPSRITRLKKFLSEAETLLTRGVKGGITLSAALQGSKRARSKLRKDL